jgi:hypothetical protein
MLMEIYMKESMITIIGTEEENICGMNLMRNSMRDSGKITRSTEKEYL